MQTTALNISILHKEHARERQLRYILCLLTCLLACVYVYFVSASVLNIIARKEAHTAVSQVASDIASLEGDYFALAENITPETAYEIGLRPVVAKTFVTRTSRLGQATEIPGGGL